MLSYGLVDALLTELRVTGSKGYPISTASTATTSYGSYVSAYGPSMSGLLDSTPTTIASLTDSLSALGTTTYAPEEYEDVLLVSISPEYELDKEDVEHVFSVLGDLKGQVSIICGHRALVKVTAGQGATIAAILDGHTLNGIPGSLKVALIETKLVTPPASPLGSFLALPKAMPKSAVTPPPTRGVRTTTADSGGGRCSSGGAAQLAFQTPPQIAHRRPARKTSDTVATAQIIRKWTARYEIQIPTNNSFQVTRKIIGARGCNMKSINEATGAKLRLRGRGSGYLEGMNNEECEDPLHLCISSCDEKMFNLARAKVDHLLQNVYQQFYQYAIQNGLPNPTLYKIRRKEQFLPNR